MEKRGGEAQESRRSWGDSNEVADWLEVDQERGGAREADEGQVCRTGRG